MATSDDSSSPLPFLEQAKYWLEDCYPNWRTIYEYNVSLDQQMETICIPDALDVLPNRRLENPINLSFDDERAYKRNYVGQTGEDKFFSAFRKLKLGGILISGFNTEEFITKMRKEKVMKLNYEKIKKQKRHFECDAIFVHRQLGVFIIEIKGCSDSEIALRRSGEAANQLKKIICGMKKFFHHITGIDYPFDFKGVICMPNVVFKLPHFIYKVLDKSEIESEQFRQFWVSNEVLQPLQCFTQSTRAPSSNDMFPFLAGIIGYRSAKFVSMPTNAMEIYRIIDQQQFQKVNEQNTRISSGANMKFHQMKADAVILNEEQLRAVECTGQHLIISGPAGTGKTTVMLLRALNAAKLDKPGRVIIMTGFFFAGAPELKSLFRKFFEDNRSSEIKRKIEVVDNNNGVLPRNQINLEDDIFLDEAPSRYTYPSAFAEGDQSVWGQMPSELVTGSTTVIMIGCAFPLDVARARERMHRRNFPGDPVHYIELTKVIRGTISIVDEWRRFYPSGFIALGHSVKGAPVERIFVSDRSHLLTSVEQKLRTLLGDNPKADYELSNNFQLAPCHLAILVGYEPGYGQEDDRELLENRFAIIKERMTSKGFPCGTIKEQLNNRKLIGIGYPYEALSFDWPAVIYIKLYPTINKNYQQDELLAFSRCISKLIIIEKSLVISHDLMNLYFKM